MDVAEAAAKRSEDPFRKVGAAGMTSDGRIIAVGYNGLAPGFSLTSDQWLDRDFRRTRMIHAEQNLCSLIKRGEVETVATTLSPCQNCIKLLAAHGVKTVIYKDIYEFDETAFEIAKELNIDLKKINGV